MDVQMLVHRVSNTSATATVKMGDDDVVAQVTQIEVELSDPKGQFGTWLLVFRTNAEKEYAAKFVQGEMIPVTLP